MKIGVFDSGLGGQIVAKELRKYFADVEFVVVNDHDNMPYGSKHEEEIIRLTDSAIKPLLGNCPIIVLACNTATAAAIDTLRERYPSTQFVGYEPMIKTAALGSKSRQATVLATPSTIKSARYQLLKQAHGDDLLIHEPHLPDWATKIEQGEHDTLHYSGLIHSIEQGSDTVVLACTHYLAIKDEIKKRFPSVEVIEPTDAIARRIRTLLDEQA